MAAPEIIDRVKKVHDFLTVGAAAPLMEAAVVGLKFEDSYYKAIQETYTHKRELFLGGLEQIGLNFTRPQGAYYVLMDISEFGYEDDEQFCIDLAKKGRCCSSSGLQLFQGGCPSSGAVPFCKAG